MIIIAGKEYGRVEDIAKVFGRSPKTIYRWIYEGRFPRGRKSPTGQIWEMSKIAALLDKGQPSTKEIKLIAEMIR